MTIVFPQIVGNNADILLNLNLTVLFRNYGGILLSQNSVYSCVMLAYLNKMLNIHSHQYWQDIKFLGELVCWNIVF